ncbi:MAG: SAM-dependent methyltransferase [Roseobacter sp.]|nr:SAM-dependent methyltransferase [Roseobacter sp.]
MTSRDLHTDRTALAHRRSRASLGEASFAHDAAIDEVEYRLSLVNRVFTKPLLISGASSLWQAAFPGFASIKDDETLMCAPQTQDLVLHSMSLHWANDVVGQLIQARNALKPDGLFVGCLFGGNTLHELRKCLSEAEIALTGGLSPRVAMAAEIRDLGQLMQRAGFALPVADKITLTASYDNIFHLSHDLRRMGETNALALRKRTFEKRELFGLANEIYKEHFSEGDGRIIATFEIVFLTGWAPHESQQKPLRPGSAQARLADALKTHELKLPDPDA